jgi:pantoate--beta-alanine ligase
MIIFKEIGALQTYLDLERKKGRTIGFVPTMGALHKGHLSLIGRSKEECGLTVCSIFVNPTQFNDPADFEKYPVTTATDIRLLIKEGTGVLFLPSVEEMYPAGLRSVRHYKLGQLEKILEGAHRPGHFQGVCQVVHRLVDIVRPDKMFLGQKDYQQCMVLKKLMEILAAPTRIIIGDTVREESGLALSSRNLRLSEEEKLHAATIYRALNYIKENISTKTFGELQQQATSLLLQDGFNKVDYIAIADANTLKLQNPRSKYDGQASLVALAAAFIGEVRLIDNLILR